MEEIFVSLFVFLLFNRIVLFADVLASPPPLPTHAKQ